MTEYYLDVETEGTDPARDKIISIQFQSLIDGNPQGEFHVLTEWEFGEKEVVRMILERQVLDAGWDFVPIGNRLKFDLAFLIERSQKHGLIQWGTAELKHYFFAKPMIDLGPMLVLMNAGKFQGSSIMNFTGKSRPSAEVPVLYHQGRYKEIIEYVEREREVTIALYRELRALLTPFGSRKKLEKS